MPTGLAIFDGVQSSNSAASLRVSSKALWPYSPRLLSYGAFPTSRLADALSGVMFPLLPFDDVEELVLVPLRTR